MTQRPEIEPHVPGCVGGAALPPRKRNHRKRRTSCYPLRKRRPDTPRAPRTVRDARDHADALKGENHMPPAGSTLHARGLGGAPARSLSCDNADEFGGASISELQRIEGHRLDIPESMEPRYIMSCLFLNGTHRDISESAIARASHAGHAAVLTYWHVRGLKKSKGSKKRPLMPTELSRRPAREDGVADVCLRVVECKHRDASTYRVQMVGSPAHETTWLASDKLPESSIRSFEQCLQPDLTPSLQIDPYAPPQDDERGELQAILDHTVSTCSDGKWVMLRCLWASGEESWEWEVKVQRMNNAAVLTYWHHLRRPKVPHRYFRILGHGWKDGKFCFYVQWVGYTACMNYKLGFQDVTMEPAGNVQEDYRQAYDDYVRKHELGI